MRILIVDDEEVLRDVLEAVLRREGFDVVMAATGEHALAILDEDDVIDLVVFVEDGQRLFAARGHGHVKAFPSKDGVEYVPKDFLIIDDQYSHSVQCPSGMHGDEATIS